MLKQEPNLYVYNITTRTKQLFKLLENVQITCTVCMQQTTHAQLKLQTLFAPDKCINVPHSCAPKSPCVFFRLTLT